jgi:hypothetical protein
MGKKAKLVERRSIMTKDNEQEVFEVQELLGKRVVRGKTQYKGME